MPLLHANPRVLIGAMLPAILAVFVLAATSIAADHEVEGRFSIESDAGGAVWAFQPGELVILTGPGDLVAEGHWSPTDGSVTDFDATITVTVTGQELSVLGAVSPDRTAVALYVAATPPTKPDAALPWPPVSRLIGQRLGMVAQPTPSPSPEPAACLRPTWGPDGVVDWDPCASTDGTTAVPSSSPLPATAP